MNVKMLCAFVLAMGLGNLSQGQQFSAPNQPKSGNWNPFAALFNKPAPSSPRLAQPMRLPQRKNSILDYFPSLPTITNQPTKGYSIYPTRDQLPGLEYLKGFGYRHGGQN